MGQGEWGRLISGGLVEICEIVGGMVWDRIGRFKVDLMEGEGFELVGWERRKRGKRGKREGWLWGDGIWYGYGC